MFKFLIDECLSPTLANAARANGFEAQHVNWLNLSGRRDPGITARAIADDWIVVTNNGVDYRAIYRSMDIHPGLVIIIPRCLKEDQVRLFQQVLDRLQSERDIVNKLVEVDLEETISIREFPPFARNI